MNIPDLPWSTFSLPEADGLPISLLRGGNTNSTYRLGDRFVLKLGGVLSNEMNFLQVARENGVLVPRLLRSGNVDGYEFIIMEYRKNTVSGRDAVLITEEWYALGLEAGKELRKIHVIGTRLEQSVAKKMLRAFLTLPHAHIIERDAYETALDRLLTTACDTFCFAHGDFTPHNLLVDVDTHQLAAIIDPSARIQEAPPALDIVRAKISRWSTPEFFEGLRTGYDREIDPTIFALFECVLSGHYAEIYAAMGDEAASRRLKERFERLV